MALDDRFGVKFAGVKMRSPIGIPPINMPLGDRSAINPRVHAEILLDHAAAGAGYIYIPGCNVITEEMITRLKPLSRPREYPRVSRYALTRFMKGDINGPASEGMYLLQGPMVGPPEAGIGTFKFVCEIIEILQEKRPKDVALIAVVRPLGIFSETAVASAREVEKLGVDMVELQLSCGHMASVEGAVEMYQQRDFPLMMIGSLMGDQVDLVERVTREVARAVNLPVGVKLSAEVGFPRVVDLANRLKNAGASYLVMHNIPPTIAPPDIYNGGKTLWPGLDGNPFVSAVGGWLRLITYKNIAGVAKYASGIDLAAEGGLVKPEHAVEALMLGARAVGFGSGMLTQGRNILRETVTFLDNYMKEQGYKSIEEVIGLGLQHIKPLDKVSATESFVAKVNTDKCQGKGICMDTICVAFEKLDLGKSRVKPDACNGCGLCVVSCPNNAIEMVPRE